MEPPQRLSCQASQDVADPNHRLFDSTYDISSSDAGAGGNESFTTRRQSLANGMSGPRRSDFNFRSMLIGRQLTRERWTLLQGEADFQEHSAKTPSFAAGQGAGSVHSTRDA